MVLPIEFCVFYFAHRRFCRWVCVGRLTNYLLCYFSLRVIYEFALSALLLCLLCVRSLFLVSCSSRLSVSFMHMCKDLRGFVCSDLVLRFVLLGYSRRCFWLLAQRNWDSPAAVSPSVSCVCAPRRAAVMPAWHMRQIYNVQLSLSNDINLLVFRTETIP